MESQKTDGRGVLVLNVTMESQLLGLNGIRKPTGRAKCNDHVKWD